MKELLFFYPLLTTFISKDIRLLSEEHNIKEFSFFSYEKLIMPWLFFKQLIFLIKNIKKTDVIICKFAGFHTFLPLLFAKTFNKPGIIITGGMDCVSFPSIKYGVFSKFPISWFAAKSFEMATKIVSVHKSLILSEYTYDTSMPSYQGYKTYTGLSDSNKDVVIHNGYDPEYWFRDPNINRPKNSFLTVLSNFEFSFNYKRKGIDLLLEVSQLLPDCKFTIIGIDKNVFDPELYKNVNFTSNVPNDQLQKIYSAHSFYLQLSLYEGFPNALCEAMLCECVPIVSNVGGNNDIVEDTGFVLLHKDSNLLLSLINEALKSDIEKLGKSARSKIENFYPESNRKQKLIELLNTILFKKTK